MPLVVPGINSKDSGSGSGTDSWMTKLMGKTLADKSDETSFAKKDLPQNHRVVEEGGFLTMDHNPDRLNVHVDKDGTVKKVTKG
ncbi:hypothetical protein A1O1_06270 [Capronia coronata CBS 617.96]|uniref:Proteinase inhibitor I78 n=1 Tax=Capronia coronata CBS 617.96 TaxID=1182541 RepID=W9Y9K5_9EURO|nr:uncharacterized protein A1O1_06270 [Capronia coronata CBS 617.96]EXJ85901.1 hypothetical protein A1O1_06270 [Capronia coronata CBS 617.96]